MTKRDPLPPVPDRALTDAILGLAIAAMLGVAFLVAVGMLVAHFS